MVYNRIVNNKKPLIAVLIDPENYTKSSMFKTLEICEKTNVSLIFLGGSIVSNFVQDIANLIKQYTKIPLVLFPGSLMQITQYADAILLLSLISGRNPELLIGNHVVSAKFLKNSGLEIIPTGYILIDCGHISAVQYISNTLPIPSDKTDLIISTALAGQLLGLKCIYLEAGSGSPNAIPSKIIKDVKKEIDIPIIIGGGIKQTKHIEEYCNAGVDVIVIGNSVENDPNKLYELLKIF